jgi:3-oxoacyl-(acyl-carrier-protein) synthase
MRIAITGIGPLNAAARSRRGLAALAEGPAVPAPAAGGRLPMSEAPSSAGSSPLRQMDTLGRFAVAAATLAISDAGVVVHESEAERVGLALGTGYGCLGTNLEYLEGIKARGTRFGNPIVFQNTVPNAATGYVSIALGIRGPNATFTSGRAAAAEAMAFGCDQIEDGRVHTVVVGGADHLSRAALEVLDSRVPLSPSGIGRPHDPLCDGIVASEGACFLVLEEMERAAGRGATVHAEIVGIGHAGGETRAAALASAVREALARAELGPADVDLVVSGANGSREADRGEAEGLRTSLGGPSGRIAMTCPKSWLGETVGSGAAFCVAIAALSLATRTIPPTAAGALRDLPLRAVTYGAQDADPDFSVALVPVLGDDETAHAIVLRRTRRVGGEA